MDDFVKELKLLCDKHKVSFQEDEQWACDESGNDICVGAIHYIVVNGEVDYSITLEEIVRKIKN